MKVALICEKSGVVREAFKKHGHYAVSYDIEPNQSQGLHIQGDCRDQDYSDFDLAICFPECRYLTCTGNKWMLPKYKERFPERRKKRIDAINFFLWCAQLPVKRIAIENPVGIMSTAWMPPTQYIHPWQFGEKASKKTGLWLKNLPALIPTKIVTPDMIISSKGRAHNKWHYETSNLPKKEKSAARSKFFPGVATAMAEQWGILDD